MTVPTTRKMTDYKYDCGALSKIHTHSCILPDTQLPLPAPTDPRLTNSICGLGPHRIHLFQASS